MKKGNGRDGGREFSDEQLLADGPIGDFLTLPSIENPDWDFARNRRCVLMAPSVEWIQSIFSCQFDLDGKKFITPNRDYPYEGLMAFQDSEHWKIVDCIALAVQHMDGSPIPISAGEIQVNPWQMTYQYEIPGSVLGKDAGARFPINITYYLNARNSPETLSGCIELHIPDWPLFQESEISPLIQPFIDIRHMYKVSDFSGYRWTLDCSDSEENRIQVSNYNRTITFYAPRIDVNMFANPQMLRWRYKLGTGSRVSSLSAPQEAPVFVGEEKEIAAFFYLRIPPDYRSDRLRLYFNCGLDHTPAKRSVIVRQFQESRENDWRQFQQIARIVSIPDNEEMQKALIARIAGLIKFKTYIEPVGGGEPLEVPHAGAMWFRSPWFRDVFEGILNSFDTLMRLPQEKESIKRIVLLAFRDQDKVSGRITNHIPEFKNSSRTYNNTDGTLLAFIVANEYVRVTRDPDFAATVLPHALLAISCFSQERIATAENSDRDGPPHLEKTNGLLRSVPDHSWIDTQNMSMELGGQWIEKIPNRASQEFIRALYDAIGIKGAFSDLLHSPQFFLPEINAQWMTMLQGTLETIDLVAAAKTGGETHRDSLLRQRQEIAAILARAKLNFKPMFWNPDKGFLFNMSYESIGLSVKDAVECETSITAAAMLGRGIFTESELQAIWQWAKKTLMVNRRLVYFGSKELPFGLLTKNEGQGIFYNDRQYHSDVIWLRSTPYLIRLLMALADKKTVGELLLNTLDHQMSEGAIFYNQELFSKPEGINFGRQEKTASNPVPVKNPVQFWSQWCDAFVRFLADKECDDGQ